MAQSYSNHRHRPWWTLVAGALGLAAVTGFVLAHLGYRTLMFTQACVIAAVVCLTWGTRRYITRLQDRIIRLEMRYRADRMLAPDVRATLWTLTRGQIIALRFASDSELPALIARAAREKLSPAEIKKAIKDWQPDWERT